MPSTDPDDIEPVLIDPDHCSQCGTAVERGTFEGRDVPWCPACDLAFSRTAIPVVQGLVYEGDSVLMLDELIPQMEGFWSLPGGHVQPGDGPEASLLRELREETGLRADTGDLEFLTTYHNEIPGRSFYLLTYAIEHSRTTGEIETEGEGVEATFRTVEEIRSSDRVRESDLDRVEQLLAVQ